MPLVRVKEEHVQGLSAPVRDDLPVLLGRLSELHAQITACADTVSSLWSELDAIRAKADGHLAQLEGGVEPDGGSDAGSATAPTTASP